MQSRSNPEPDSGISGSSMTIDIVSSTRSTLRRAIPTAGRAPDRRQGEAEFALDLPNTHRLVSTAFFAKGFEAESGAASPLKRTLWCFAGLPDRCKIPGTTWTSSRAVPTEYQPDCDRSGSKENRRGRSEAAIIDSVRVDLTSRIRRLQIRSNPRKLACRSRPLNISCERAAISPCPPTRRAARLPVVRNAHGDELNRVEYTVPRSEHHAFAGAQCRIAS